MSKQISKIYHAAIYVRLSKEDGDVSTSAKAESNSISNQKDFIRNFLADKKDIRIVKEYVDDGYSGSNFDRPSFQTMMEDIKRGVIDCVVVKDLSRFGREYIDSGRYIERLFPALGVRFIAINDNYDSVTGKSQGDEIIIPFKNLINDAYCRDISIKIQENTALPDKEKKVLFKAGLYARLSHEKEENIERGTIETQMELMKNYVKDHEDIVIEEEYYDASFTGTNFERPDFKRMLEDAKTGRINCIIVKDLSRLGRNYVEMGNYIERVFPFLNVRFIAVTDDFDSFRPGTDLMMPLKNIVNEFYAKDISKKVSTAHRRKWTTDEYMCGFAPYGYLKSKTEKNRIVVDEATAGNVRFIYKLFLDGKGYTPIAKYLNEQGIMSPLMYLKSLGYQQNVRTNGVWTKTTVKSILTNQAYIGSAVHGKVVIEKYNNIPLHATDPSEWVVVENTHEPLIDKKTFEKAQERVKEISDAYFAKEFTKHPPNEMNLLKGKIVCGDCGKGMRLSPRTTKSYVYFCGTFSDGINPACSRHKIDQEEVNKAVFAQISNHMRCCIDALKVIRELNARSSGLKKYDVYEKAITRQRRELEKVNRKFSELYGDYSEHLINESEYLTLKQQYLLKSEALKKEIDNLLVSQNLYSKNYKIDEDWENLINKYLKCRKLNKELADAFVDKVQVFEDGRISVNLVYDDCLEELLQVKNKREGDLYE